MTFLHHHHRSNGNQLRFIFRLLSLLRNNPSIPRHSQHHNIGKFSNNIKNLYRLILLTNTPMFLTTHTRTTGWTSLGTTLTRRTTSTLARTIRTCAYINKYLGLISLQHSEDQKEPQEGKPEDMMTLYKPYYQFAHHLR